MLHGVFIQLNQKNKYYITGKKFSMLKKILLLICLYSITMQLYSTDNLKVAIELGVNKEGSQSTKWISAITDRHSSEKIQQIRNEKTPLTVNEKKWLELFKEIIPIWNNSRANLNTPFKIKDYPRKLTILFGNNGGDDGFSFNCTTICCDLSSWAHTYEPPDKKNMEASKARISHILSHEYTHILTHLWLKQHPYKVDTPLKRALFECWLEGLGNYYSFSSSWYSSPKKLSPKAFKVLKQLEPVFVSNLIKLSETTDSKEEAQLTEHLSKGSFTKKWGAVTVALWLRLETKCNNQKLTKWIEAGPNGILLLAEKYLPKKEKEELFNNKAIRKILSKNIGK